jgi:hypothetical protein
LPPEKAALFSVGAGYPRDSALTHITWKATADRCRADTGQIPGRYRADTGNDEAVCCGNQWLLARNVRYRTDMLVMFINAGLYRGEATSCKSSFRLAVIGADAVVHCAKSYPGIASELI